MIKSFRDNLSCTLREHKCRVFNGFRGLSNTWRTTSHPHELQICQFKSRLAHQTPKGRKISKSKGFGIFCCFFKRKCCVFTEAQKPEYWNLSTFYQQALNEVGEVVIFQKINNFSYRTLYIGNFPKNHKKPTCPTSDKKNTLQGCFNLAGRWVAIISTSIWLRGKYRRFRSWGLGTW